MKQAVMVKPGVIENRNIPSPSSLGNDEVLLSIKRIGICGSDIHVFRGEHPAVTYPVVQGHEYSAIVKAVGKNVKHIKVGMRVTARPQLTCGECKPCRRAQYNICQNLKVEGFQAPGAAQEFFIVSVDRIVPFPEIMSLDHGAMVEPVSVAVHSTGRASSMKGKNVVVSGAGPIGNLAAQYAKVRGADKVMITDISDNRLTIAEQCGITGIVNVAKESFKEKAVSFFGSEGFQVAMDAAGVQDSLDILLKNIENGGEIIIIAVYAENPEINMYYLGEHELELKGSLMYLHEDYEEAVEKISSNQINLDPLISDHFPFDEFEDAYRYIEQKRDNVMKVIMNF